MSNKSQGTLQFDITEFNRESMKNNRLNISNDLHRIAYLKTALHRPSSTKDKATSSNQIGSR